MGVYDEVHRRSLADPEAFWAEAADLIDWVEPPTTVLDRSAAPFYRWFTGGVLNTAWNALDRHVEGGRAEQVRFTLEAGPIKDTYELAYEWDGDDAVRWSLAAAGSVLSDMAGSYRLTDEAGGTKVVYELAVGIKIPMIGMVKRKAEKMIMDTALKELKRRVEATD